MAATALAAEAAAALETRSRAVDERLAAQETALFDKDEDDASDPGRLCAYIGADSLAPVRG